MRPPATTISRSRGSRSWVIVISWSPSISTGIVVEAVRDLLQAARSATSGPARPCRSRPVLEQQRDDPLGDQVAPVDPREALRDHGPDAELRRRERGVLAARALAVVVAGDDEASAPLLRAARELRVAVLERELGDRRHVRAVGHDRRAVGREVAGRDVVGRDDQHAQLERVGQLLLLGRRLDVRAARDLDRRRLVGRHRLEDVTPGRRRAARAGARAARAPSARADRRSRP